MSRSASTGLAKATAALTSELKRPSGAAHRGRHGASILPSPTSSIHEFHEDDPETLALNPRQGSTDAMEPDNAPDMRRVRSGSERSVGTFLEDLGLREYVDIFAAEGFDTMDSVREITEADMSHMGVKRGHRRVIQRAIASRKGISVDMPLNVSSAVPGTGGTSLSETNPQASRSVTQTNRNVFYINRGRVPQVASQPESTGKRRYRRHPKPDVNAPEKPPSAYVMFSNQVREELKGKTVSFTEIARMVGDRWKNLDSTTKETIERKAAEAKERWQALVANYKKTPQYAEYQAYLLDFKAKHGGLRSSQANSGTPRSTSSRKGLPEAGPSVVRPRPGPSRGGHLETGAEEYDEDDDESQGMGGSEDESDEAPRPAKRHRTVSPGGSDSHLPRVQPAHALYPYHPGGPVVYGPPYGHPVEPPYASGSTHHPTPAVPLPLSYSRYASGSMSVSVPVGSNIILAGPPGPPSSEAPRQSSPGALPVAHFPSTTSGRAVSPHLYASPHLPPHASSQTSPYYGAAGLPLPMASEGPGRAPIPFSRPVSHTRGEPPISSIRSSGSTITTPSEPPASASSASAGTASTSAASLPTLATVRSLEGKVGGDEEKSGGADGKPALRRGLS